MIKLTGQQRKELKERLNREEEWQAHTDHEDIAKQSRIDRIAQILKQGHM